MIVVSALLEAAAKGNSTNLAGLTGFTAQAWGHTTRRVREITGHPFYTNAPDGSPTIPPGTLKALREALNLSE